MVRFKATLAAAALGLLTLTACGGQVQDVTDAAGDVTDAAGDAAGSVTDAAGDAAGTVTDAAGDAAGTVTDVAGDATGAVTDAAGDAAGAVTDAAGDATGAVTDAVSGAQDQVAALAGIPAFTSSATATLDAVKSGDFETAKAEVANLQDSWGSISTQVQEKAPDVHTKVEEGITSVTSSLDGDAPDTEQISTTITDIIASIKDVAL